MRENGRQLRELRLLGWSNIGQSCKNHQVGRLVIVESLGGELVRLYLVVFNFHHVHRLEPLPHQ